MYLMHGVLYVANVNSGADAKEQTAAFHGEAIGPDVLFCGGGITGPMGHPIKLYRRLHTSYGGDAPTFSC